MEASWWTASAELDEEQKKVVSLPTSADHLIVGPPGCGKTNLLLLRAAFLHRKGQKNIVVLSFGRVLREFLSSGSTHYPFSPDKVQTYLRWGAELLNSSGKVFVEGENFEKTRSLMFKRLSELQKESNPENVFDVILIDEVQDYSADEIELIKKFSNRLFAVGDINQRISDKEGALDRLVALGAKRSRLTSHYRNGIKICRVADGIKNLIDHEDGMEATSNYDEANFPSTSDVFSGMKLKDQLIAAVPRIETQLQAYPGELIGVLCPKVADLDLVSGHFKSAPFADEIHVQKSGAYSAFSPDRRVILSTTMGAKGLEYRAVHILAAEKFKKFSVQRNLTYTSVTRTKTSLSVYHDGSLAGYFEKGLSAAQDCKPSEPTLDELFK